MVRPSFFMSSAIDGSELRADLRSCTRRLARSDSEPVPVAVDAALAALTDALKVLKKFPSADVASAAVVALDRVVIAFAATCPSDKADFTKPNFEICAVVTSASAWMRFSA